MKVNSTNNSNITSFGTLNMAKSSLKALQEAKKNPKIEDAAIRIERAYQHIRQHEKSDKINSFTLLWGINPTLGTVNLTFSHAAKLSKKLFAKFENITAFDTVSNLLPPDVETIIYNYIHRNKV